MKNEEFPDVVSDFQVQCVGKFFGVSRSLAARDSVCHKNFRSAIEKATQLGKLEQSKAKSEGHMTSHSREDCCQIFFLNGFGKKI